MSDVPQFSTIQELLGYLKQQRRLAQEAADQTLTEYVPAPPAEDPTVMLPEPVADPSGQPLREPDGSVPRGRVTSAG